MTKNTLKISEMFYSFQGESTFMGEPTIFIRLYGCNLDCSICDTKYAMRDKNYKTLTIENIIKIISKIKAPYVCITGGEPLLQMNGLRSLISVLLKKKKIISVETNGSISIKHLPKSIKRVIDVKTPNTGCKDSFNMNNLKYITVYDEVKFVISNKNDFDFAQKFVSKNKIECSVLMSPNLTKLGLANKLVQWILKSNRPYIFQPQLHKLIKERPLYLVKRV